MRVATSHINKQEDNMNKFGVLIALLAFTLVSCTNQSKKQADENIDAAPIDQSVIDSHTSEMSLDWAGVYSGVMPCADCEGIETVIELKDDRTYVAHYTYLGTLEDENKFTNEGTFTFDVQGNNITLRSGDETSQYKVGENQIILLNTDGTINTGELADFYVLKKKM